MNLTIEDRIRRVMAVGQTRKVTNLARSLRVKRSEIEDAVQGMQGFDLLVGIQVGCPGGGYADIDRSDWEIERYE